jgi:hypothetical protein
MRQGGKIVGFYPNFRLEPILIDDIEALQNVLQWSRSGRIYYAGSEKSARVVQRFNQALSTSGTGPVARLIRIATMLFSVTPAALVANRLEAAAPEEQSTQMPQHCTSITIDVTI